MKALITFLMTLLLYTMLYSQWVQQNPLTYQNDITSVYFTDANNGWAAADYGMIFNTTDGGVNWLPIPNQPDLREKLNSVFFVSSSLGYAAGNNGTIYKITTTGTAKQVSNTTMNLNSVFFTSADIGYCSGNGGTILKTTNGGTTWVKLTTGTTYNLSSIYFTDSNTGYAAGGLNSGLMGIILKTTNGGTTWKVQYSGHENRYLYSIYFKNSTTGWVSGWNGTMMKTTNGGTTWFVLPRVAAANLMSIHFSDLQNGLAVGAYGTIIKTTNGGTSWVKLTSGTKEQLNTTTLLIGNSVVAAGNTGMLLKSENNGTTWDKHLVVNKMNLQKVSFTSKNIGWILGACYTECYDYSNYMFSMIYKTTDGGQTWGWKKLDNQPYIGDLSVINDQEAWALCGGLLFKTTNGGNDWIPRFHKPETISGSSYLTSVYFLDSNTGWVTVNIVSDLFHCTDELTAFYTTDGGENWNIGNNNNAGFYFSVELLNLKIYFKDKDTGWMVGTYYAPGIFQVTAVKPVLLKSTNGGKNWALEGGGIGYFDGAVDIQFSDNSNGFIVGKYSEVEEPNSDDIPGGPGSYIQRTTNGGSTWTIKAYQTPFATDDIYGGDVGMVEFLKSISFPTPSTGYAVGTGMLKTTDYGETWSMETLPVSSVLNSVCFTGPDDGWVVGENSVILKYDKDAAPLPINWRASINFNGGFNNILSLGQNTFASDGIDSQLGEEDLPPLPPAGNPDVRFLLPDNISTTINDIRNSNDKNIIWNIPLQNVNEANEFYGFNLYWDGIFRILPGNVYLTDGLDGSLLNINMKDTFHIEINGKPPYNSLKIIYTVNNPVNQTSTVSYNQNWNITSVPLKATYMTKAALFPGITSDAFEFSGKYFTADVLENGKGYWMKADNAGTSQISGTEVNSLISINKGWNLIAPFNKAVTIGQVTTQPAGIITSPFYGFDGNGYNNAATLNPGKGYWVKSSSTGVITYSTGTGKENNLLADIKPNWGKIIIEDNERNSSTLYDVTEKEVNLNQYELPPMPPNGVFDVRYSSGLMADRLNEEGKSIQVSSAVYPISIKAEEIDLLLRYNAGNKQEDVILSSGNTVTINQNSVRIIEVKRTSDRSIPKEFTLHQNYPNPFNPVTKIKFDLPEKTNVNLSIYNILGEKIAELVNKEMEAGYQEISFNANSLSSGIYFYRIDTNKNHVVKKMMLLK